MATVASGSSGYDLPPHTPGFAEAQSDMTERSREAAGLPSLVKDLPYGADVRQKLDIFSAGRDAPVLVFLRGGYWRVGEKEDRWFPASEWLARGVSWVVPNYRLAPDASLPDIVADAQAALDWLLAQGKSHGIDPAQIHLVGNSAGAHLAAMLGAGPAGAQVRSLTLLSGLYDLVPLVDEEPNDWLKMDRETAIAMSPSCHLPPARLPVTVCCGGTETDAFKDQSARYAATLRDNGNPVEHFLSPGRNHMEIILECGTPGSPVFEALERHLGLR